MLDLLRERGGERIKVFGGGGGVIVPEEIAELQAYGVSRIYSPEDGQKMGLQGMINDMVMQCDVDLSQYAPRDLKAVKGADKVKARRAPVIAFVAEGERELGKIADAVFTVPETHPLISPILFTISIFVMKAPLMMLF